jgi:hypothetical protein
MLTYWAAILLSEMMKRPGPICQKNSKPQRMTALQVTTAMFSNIASQICRKAIFY